MNTERASDHSRASAGARLVADIGGSNARFGWIPAGGSAVGHVIRLPVADHPDLVHAARAYVETLRSRLGPDFQAPRAAALAVATAVTGDRVDFTNSVWGFSQREACAALGLQSLVVLNDFEALALALPRLQPGQVRAHGAAPSARATMAVIGPGTGLGVAAVVPTAQGWVAIPGEGGHATLAADDDAEAAVLAYVRRRFPHVSAERLLSGIGLPLLHEAIGATRGDAAGAEVDAQSIVERGLAGDAACRRTLQAFCALLGSFAGNVALTLGARGGVYVGGGIVPRLGDLFFESAFRQRFEAKGRLQGYLAAIPSAVITDTLAALTGAAAALE
jgi:glucokinase